MHEPFSVLMTVYYKEDPVNLEAALHSIWGSQTLKPNQIVLVVDGPIGNNLEIVINKWSSREEINLCVIRLESNLGLPLALNKGLEYCSYELVGRMDSDDICRSDRFVKQIPHMVNNPSITVSGSWIQEFSEDLNDLKEIRKVPSDYNDVFGFAKRRCPLNHMSVVFRKSKVIETGGYNNLSNSQDYHLWGRMLARGYQIDNIPEVLVFARADKSFQSRRGGSKFIGIEYVIFRDFYKVGFLKLHEAIMMFLGRVFVRLVPGSLRSFLYSKFFRTC